MTTTLTFAELAFLLADASPEARRRLNLQDWDSDGPVVMSGGASLVARELLRQDGTDLLAHESLAPVLECLVDPSRWVSVGTVRGPDEEELQIFDGSTGRWATTVLPYGALAIDPLDTGTPVSDVVARLVTGFIAVDEPGAVFVCKAAGEPDDGLAIRRNAAGAIEVARGRVATAEIEAVDADRVGKLVEEFMS